MEQFSVLLKGEEATQKLAQTVARYVVPGDVILLKGTLGAGKSTFARAFIRALDARKGEGHKELSVPSPTFTLVQTYDVTRLPAAHVDCYRMGSAAEFADLDLDDYFTDGVTLIEWPENAEGALPVASGEGRGGMMEAEVPDVLTLTLEDAVSDETAGAARAATLSAEGTWVKRFGLMGGAADVGREVSAAHRSAVLQGWGLDGEHAAVSADCSFRTYWRVQGVERQSLVLMDAPPPMEDVRPFAKTAAQFAALGVRVPTVFKADEGQGYLLLEDFGGVSFSKGFSAGADQKAWLERTVDLLAHIAKHPNKPADLPVYSAGTAWGEASRFTDWYLPYATGRATLSQDRRAFKEMWTEAYNSVLSQQPQTVCHWDFHSDNLMMLGGVSAVQSGGLDCVGVLDFQDARLGPVAFDLACLLEDRYPTPEDLKPVMIKRFVDALDGAVTMSDFMAAYHLCAAHRFFKVTGLYMRLLHRDGRDEGALPWKMEHIWSVLGRSLAHPACADVLRFVERRLGGLERLSV